MRSFANVLVERHVRLVPWILGSLVLAALSIGFYIALMPMYKYTLTREREQSVSAIRGVENSLKELLNRTSLMTDAASQDKDLREKVDKALMSHSDVDLSRLAQRVSLYAKAYQFRFIEVATPEGKVLVVSGRGHKTGDSIANWKPFRETTETRNALYFSQLSDEIMAVATAKIRIDGQIKGVLIAGSAIDEQFLSALSKNLAVDISLSANGRNVFSTLRNKGGEQAFFGRQESENSFFEMEGNTYALREKPIPETYDEAKSGTIASVAVIISMSGFFDSLSVIMGSVVKILVPFMAIVIGFIVAVSGSLVRMSERLKKLQLKLEGVLSVTHDLAACRDRVEAAKIAVGRIIQELSFGDKVSADVFFADHAALAQTPSSSAPPRILRVRLADGGDFLQEPALEAGRADAAEGGSLALGEGNAVCVGDALNIPIMKEGACLGSIRIAPYAQSDDRIVDLRFAATVASSLAITLENIQFLEETKESTRVEAELQAIRAIQEQLLPNSFEYPGLEIASHFQPASQAGGDWYGMHYDRLMHRMNIFIGDVTGHGIASALITGVVCGAIHCSELRTDLRVERENEFTAEDRLLELATALNLTVLATGRQKKMMTMAMVSLDLETGEFLYLNAGHNPLILLSKETKSTRILSNRGSRLGFTPQPGFHVQKYQLCAGDLVFMYTDGLLENAGPNNRRVREKQIKDILVRCHEPSELKEQVLEAARSVWNGHPADDDVAFLVFKWLGPAPRVPFIEREGTSQAT